MRREGRREGGKAVRRSVPLELHGALWLAHGRHHYRRFIYRRFIYRPAASRSRSARFRSTPQR